MTRRKKTILILVILLSFFSIIVYQFRREIRDILKFYTQPKEEFKLYEIKRNNFTLKNGDEYKLINSAIKQDYEILFSGNIEKFDTLIIGKGMKRFFSSYLLISRDSVIINIITDVKTRNAYKHNLSLKGSLLIDIERKVNSASVTIINENDTFKIITGFVGMDNPVIHSLGSIINVSRFEFICNDYYSDIHIFGDSYVGCYSPTKWPYYLYNLDYKFFCDGLPGGRSIDSYDYIKSALSIHKPKYVIWCLGMNDGSDKLITNLNWKYYVKKIMDLCDKNNITLILATVPSVPTRDNIGKNEFVRNSGYRYIDFDKAVSAGIGKWKKGMLSNDGVHPTELGAEAMSSVFLKDFPEIKNYSKH